MPTWLRLALGVPAFLFGAQTLLWLFAPGRAAEGLGMPLLDGIGRSTQVGDFLGFFGALATMIGLGVALQRATWLRGAAVLLGGAALGRILAWALHGAPFAADFIGIEVVSAGLLLYGASQTGEGGPSHEDRA